MGLSLLSYALLGLVEIEPQTGYALAKTFTTTPMGHYSGSPGAIYPALRRLEESGLLRGRVPSARATRPRRVYEVTARGRRTLVAWLRGPVARADVIWRMDDLMLRFAFMEGLLERSAIIAFLESHCREVEAYVGELQAHRRQKSRSLHGRLAMKAGIDGYRTQARWARFALQKVRGARGRTPRKEAP